MFLRQPFLWFGKKKINPVPALRTAYCKRFSCHILQLNIVHISRYQTWRIFVEDTGPLVIMSFSWVASHLPRPTTKQGLFIKISGYKVHNISPGSVSALLVQYERKNAISQSQPKTCQKSSCLPVPFTNYDYVVTQKIGRQLRTWWL